ncbi:MAG: gamma carbonic anhydrase family protein [Candidatus Omnitrophica bacterium]|nr:gamma carbonic anhydrase family protein [Candidatus Omnitrophota bacterium]
MSANGTGRDSDRKTVIPFRRYVPDIHPTAFIAPGASVIGRVRLGKEASIWFGTVVRGDINQIIIGESTNIQDGSILHVDDDAPCVIHDHVHVGHHVNLHGCVVEPGALIGIGAIVLSGARVGHEAIVGAGSVVLEGMRIPPRTLVVGAPARVVRSVTAREVAGIRRWVKRYAQLAKLYRRGR